MQLTSVQTLRERAHFDRDSAEILLANDGPDSVIGFLCQQAVEKLLKAVLASKGVNAPKTHDLLLLKQDLLTAGESLPAEFDDLDLLQPFAVAERYSDTGASANLTVQRACELMKLVDEWADSLLS